MVLKSPAGQPLINLGSNMATFLVDEPSAAVEEKRDKTSARNGFPCYLCGRKVSESSQRYISLAPLPAPPGKMILGTEEDLSLDNLAYVGRECVKKLPAEAVLLEHPGFA